MELQFGKGPGKVVESVYRIPETRKLRYITRLKQIVQGIKIQNKDKIIGTDQNIDYLKLSTNKYSSLLFEEMMSMEMSPTIAKPTQRTHNMASLIDNIYISNHLLRDYFSGTLIDDISDHLPCITIMNMGLRIYKEPIEVEFRKVNEENINIL